MPATFDIPTQTVIPGQLITAALWNGEFTNIFDNFDTSGMDDYSDTDGEMQTQTNPFPASVLSRPSSLSGELERLRFVAKGITGQSYWYQPPTKTIEQLNTFNLGHTHTGTTDGTKIPTAGLADDAVTGPKIAAGSVSTVNIIDSNVTTAKIADSNVTTAKINALAVTDAKINDVASTKITGTIGTSQIAAFAVTDAKINDVAASKITGTIVASQIGALAVTDAKINDVAVGKITGTLAVAHGGTGVTNKLITDVDYTGNGSAVSRNIAHGLGVAPTLIIFFEKSNGSSGIPLIWTSGNTFNGGRLTSDGTVVTSITVDATNIIMASSNGNINQNTILYRATCFAGQ